MKDYKFAIFIGRFQPLHNGHVEVIKHGLSIAEKIIILVGSTNSAPTLKNPFSFEDRKKMILDSLCPVKITKTKSEYGEQAETTITERTEYHDRVIVLPVRDYHYSYNSWIADVQSKTDQYIDDGDPVALLGDYKDGSSYYLKSFPQWDFVPIKNVLRMDSTEVREEMFSINPALNMVTGAIKTPPTFENTKNKVPDAVLIFLNDYVKHYPFRDLVLRYHRVQGYRNQWANSPFPPVFVTADAIVVCSGHVLVVTRRDSGEYALPGGFVKSTEHIKDAALRELKEETRIQVDKLILESNIVESKVFDFPDRSERGRTVTHGFYIKLKDGKLPIVRGGDDAASAFWMPLADVIHNENKFFEDHAHIIGSFVNRG